MKCFFFFQKRLILKKKSADDKKHEKLPRRQRFNVARKCRALSQENCT